MDDPGFKQRKAKQAFIAAKEAIRRGDRDKARRLAKQAIDLMPDWEDPWILMGLISEPKQGLAYIVRALEIDPTNKEAKKSIRWLMKRMPPKEHGKGVQDLRNPEEMKVQTMPFAALNQNRLLFRGLILVIFIAVLTIGLWIENKSVDPPPSRIVSAPLLTAVWTPNNTSTTANTPLPMLIPSSISTSITASTLTETATPIPSSAPSKIATPTQSPSSIYTSVPISTVTPVPTSTQTPIIPSPTATQGTRDVYYVAPDGNDSNPGTEDQPWRTPAKAAAAAQAGDTVLFRGGTYYGQLWPQNSGNPSDGWITFKAYPGEEPVIIDDAFYSRAINVIGVSFIEINGLTGVGAGANGHAIGIDNAHHVRILNCVARDSATSGIATANGLDYITIEGNRVYGNSNIGSYNGSGISIWNAGGSIYDNAPGYHIIIRDNLIYDNRNLTDRPTDGNGIILDNNDRGGTPDLQLPKTLIANNVIFHNGGKCIHVLNTSNVDIVHNSCYHNVETERLAEGCAGEINLQRTYSYSSAINIRVYNNIAYGRGGGTWMRCWGKRYVFQVFGGVEYESDYNLWYNGAIVQVGPNDIVADPLFRYPSIDPGKADFSLMSTSPAVDSGIDQFATAVPKDYLGVSRPQGEGFDRGAYE